MHYVELTRKLEAGEVAMRKLPGFFAFRLEG